jgi:hypothetical protein
MREPIVFTPKELRYNHALFHGTLTRRNRPNTPGYTAATIPDPATHVLQYRLLGP